MTDFFSCIQGSRHVTSSTPPPAQTLSFSSSDLLLHSGIHRTHIPLRILKLLNQAKVPLLICLSNDLPICFLDLLCKPSTFQPKAQDAIETGHTSTCSSILSAYKYTNPPAFVFLIHASSLFMIPPINFSPGKVYMAMQSSVYCVLPGGFGLKFQPHTEA